MVSNVLTNVSSDLSEVYELIAGLVGRGVATEFKTWSKLYSKLPNLDDIFNGRCNYIPKELDVTYALCSAMIEYAKKHKDDLALIENSIDYGLRLSPDFSLVLLKDYMYIDKDYRKKLLRIPAYNNWLQTRGRLLDEANGI